MEDGNKRIKIGQYRTGDYGIAVSTDAGATWTTAIDFDGLHGGGGETVIYQDTITKAGLAPLNPSVNDLWVDTIENRLKLWNGTEWVNIGYEPTTPDPDDGGGDEGGGDDPGTDDPTNPEDPGTDEPSDPTDPTAPGDDSGGESGGDDPGTEDNPGDETPEEGGS